jgi:hypothetical protein
MRVKLGLIGPNAHSKLHPPPPPVLLGQRNPKQVEAASKIGEALSPEEAAWVRAVYRGSIPV